MNDQEAKLFLQQIRNVSKNETQSNTKTCIKTTPAYVISINGQMATVRLVTDLTGENPFNVPIITSQTISPGDYVNLAYWDNLSTAVIFSGGNNYPICPNMPIRPNLIDNACFVGGGTGWGVFPVNQRGQTSYSGAGAVTDKISIDRWKVTSNCQSLVLQANGLSLTAIIPTQYPFYQALNGDYSRYAGKTYTVSALMGDGSLISGTGTFPVSVPQAGNTVIAQSNSGAAFDVKLMYSAVAQQVMVGFYANTESATAVISAAKLEEGAMQTLAYQKADGTWAMLPQNLDYQQELAKCQAYLQSFGIYDAFACIDATDSYTDFQVPLSVPFRAHPVVLENGGIEGLSIAWYNKGNVLRLRILNRKGTVGEVIAFSSPCFLSAEL